MATLRVCSQVQEVHAAVKGDYESNEQQLRNLERVRAEGTPGVHHCAYFAVPLPCAPCYGNVAVRYGHSPYKTCLHVGFAHA